MSNLHKQSRTRCYSPMTIPRKGGLGPTDRITIPCGKCAACINRLAQSWQIRLAVEQKYAVSAFFITLTYATENLPFNACGFPVVNVRDCQLFLKRLRKKTVQGVRYYLVSEYGSNSNRPHYHAILFLPFCLSSSDLYKLIEDTWQLGFVHIGDVNIKSLKYVTKYVFKKQILLHESQTKCFSLQSRKPGLGSQYVKTHAQYHTSNQDFTIKQDSGSIATMPRYFVEKIFTAREREQRSFEASVHANVALEEEQTEFYKNNPTGNFFQYKTELIEQFVNNLSKTSKKSIL